MAVDHPSRPGEHPALALALAAHAAPTAGVTMLSALLCLAVGVPPGTSGVLVAAVLTGQLSIGWSNDLLDLGRDRATGRPDKPLVSGNLSVAAVRRACAAALLLSLSLSALLGWRAGSAHLLVVGGGWAYNLGLKRTVWSWVPYAVAFGALACVPSLALGSALPGDGLAWWLPVTGALLGVGAHLLNVLPDLEDDRRTGVLGLPHRIAQRAGAPAVARLAVVLLVAATAILVAVLAASPAVLLGCPAVAALAVVVMTGSGRGPFLAAMGIALVDVVLLAVSL